MVNAAPISDAEFAAWMARIGGWSSGRRVAVAVSGGADSLCLAWLASRWGHPTALIVDHGLREGSDEEAAAVADRLSGFGVSAKIARLDLARGAGLAARAREARYAALTRMAVADGLLDLLVGHHARDQAETVLIRREARSGQAGLAAMAPVVETAHLRIVRPLLEVLPERLRATLVKVGIAWFEDPGNANPLATRIRFRQKLQDPDRSGMETATTAASARALGALRQAEEEAVSSVLAERVTIHPEGYALLSPGALPPAALSALLRTIGGAAYPARRLDVERLARDPRPATVAGVRLLPAGRLGDGLLVVREAAAMQPPVPAEAGVVWDRRFALSRGTVFIAGTTLGAIGPDAAGLRDMSDLPAAVLQAMPALRCEGKLTGLGLAGHPAHTPRLSFKPRVPLGGAGFFL